MEIDQFHRDWTPDLNLLNYWLDQGDLGWLESQAQFAVLGKFNSL